jgi:hypothetical protein
MCYAEMIMLFPVFCTDATHTPIIADCVLDIICLKVQVSYFRKIYIQPVPIFYLKVLSAFFGIPGIYEKVLLIAKL